MKTWVIRDDDAELGTTWVQRWKWTNEIGKDVPEAVWTHERSQALLFWDLDKARLVAATVGGSAKALDQKTPEALSEAFELGVTLALQLAWDNANPNREEIQNPYTNEPSKWPT